MLINFNITAGDCIEKSTNKFLNYILKSIYLETSKYNFQMEKSLITWKL